MEKSSNFNFNPSHPPRSRMTPKKDREKGAFVPPRSHRQRPPKASRVPEASSLRKERLQKEKPETNEVTVEQEPEVKAKSTVVDIDSVREDEVKEENLGLLEAAEQEDGKLNLEEKPGTLYLKKAKQWVYFSCGLFSFSQCVVLKIKKYVILWPEIVFMLNFLKHTF